MNIRVARDPLDSGPTTALAHEFFNCMYHVSVTARTPTLIDCTLRELAVCVNKNVAMVLNAKKVLNSNANGEHFPRIIIRIAQSSRAGVNQLNGIVSLMVNSNPRTRGARVGDGRAIGETEVSVLWNSINRAVNDSPSSSPSARVIVLGATKTQPVSNFVSRRNAVTFKIVTKKNRRRIADALDCVVRYSARPATNLLVEAIIGMTARTPNRVRKHVLSCDHLGVVIAVSTDSIVKIAVSAVI